jgi:hypothetical protein
MIPPAKSNLRVRTLVFLSAFLVNTNEAATPCSDLARAKTFCFVGESPTGRVVSYGKVFARVLREPEPVKCFQEIARNGTLEAKMLALVALREMNRTEFELQAQRLGGRHFSVVVLATEEAGIIATESSEVIIKDIRNGLFRSKFQFFRKHRLE